MKKGILAFICIVLAALLLVGCSDSGHHNYEDEGENGSYIDYEKEQLRTAQIGDKVSFGEYWDSSEDYKSAMSWIVLERMDDQVLLLSEYVIAGKSFSSGSADWSSSSIRSWLNGSFKSDAFSSEEAAMLAEGLQCGDVNPEYGTSMDYETHDKVFLLSAGEVERYFSSNSEMAAISTRYAQQHGTSFGDGGRSNWWLRTPGMEYDRAVYVLGDAGICYGGCVTGEESRGVGVRPAIWVCIG